MYSVRLRSGAHHGETPRIGGNHKNLPISELDIFSKRQALSRAFVVNSNMSSGKYLAREGPGSRLHCTGDTVKQSQRRVTSPTSKMFGQHLKCCLTAPTRAGQASDFFCFFLLSQLSEPGRLGIALSGPASRLASAMTFSGCEIDTSPTVDCCSFSICRTQSPEELGRVGERSLG